MTPSAPVSDPGPLLPRKIALFAVIFLSVAAGWIFHHHQKSARETSVPPAAGPAQPQIVPVKAYRVHPRKLSGLLIRNGTVRPRSETNLQFGVSGRIVKFDVEKGQFVRKGSVIAQLEQDEAQTIFKAAEMDFQKASVKYFQDRTIDKLEFERAKLRYNQARLEFDKTALRAPHNGYLVEKWVIAGEHVDPGTTIGKLMDKSQVFVEMSLTEEDISHIKEGQTVEMTVDAVPGLRLTGRVRSITPYLQGNARSFSVKVSLPENPRESLSPGMFARCAVRHYEKESALTIPREAGLDVSGDKVKAFFLNDQNLVHARVLPLLFTAEKDLEVDDIKDGDMVVVDPSPNLVDGAKIRIIAVYDPSTNEETSPSENQKGWTPEGRK